MTEEQRAALEADLAALGLTAPQHWRQANTARAMWLAGAAWGAAARQRFDAGELHSLADQARSEWQYPLKQAAHHILSQQMPEVKA